MEGVEGEPEGEQESGLGVWSHGVCPVTRGYQGDPWPTTTTAANKRRGPVPVHFDR